MDISENKISNVTRQNISDETILCKIFYGGRLTEPDFLSRLFDLENMPSRDHRYKNAYGDIYQHTVNNNDWADNWIYSDTRINLLHCEDERYLQFLAETLHPIVRSSQEEIDKLIEIYNRHLSADGFEIIQDGNISGKPLFSWHKIDAAVSKKDKIKKNKIIMKPLERLNLINTIAIELQRSMTFSDISAYLNAYKIKSPQGAYSSKKVFAQDAIKNLQDSLIIKIGEELGVYKSDDVFVEEESRCWTFGYFRIFISHLSKNKDSATNLKICLNEYAISGFVAHEDIEPSKEWLQEIERALFSMNSICAIVTPDFIKSTWCDQEVGVAIGRKVLVIPIRKGADPYGLFGKYQGIQSKGKDSKKIAEEIFRIISTNEKSKNIYCEMIRNLVLNAKNKEDGLKWILLLEKIPNIEPFIISELHSKFATNNNLKNNSILTVANRIFSEYNLPEINANTFVKPEIDTDDLPF